MVTVQYTEILKFKTSKEIVSYLRNKGCKRVGEGSSRVVYRISKHRVIKIAKDIPRSYVTKGAGRAQNRNEVNLSNKYRNTLDLARVLVYNYNYSWIISEYAKKCSEQEASDRYQDLLDFLCDEDLSCDVYPSSTCFGKIDNRIVITDYGANLDILNDYY